MLHHQHSVSHLPYGNACMKTILDVLIVGAGPTGSTLAIDLARRGLKVRIIDKSPEAFGGSRAKGVQPRTMEVFEDLGVIDDILAGGCLYPKLGIHVGPFAIAWNMFRNVDPTEAVPYPNTWLIPQFRIDAALHARLQELGVEVGFSSELLKFSQNAQTVTASVSTPQGQEEIEARYLVGSDGGSSPVRKMLGVDFVGSTDEQDRILIVDAAVSGLSRDRWHVWPRLGGRFIGACPLPNSNLFQWMIRLAKDESPPQGLHEISRRIQLHTGNRRIKLHNIQWQSVFRPNIRLAQAYRRGRVFLAGDAAHVHTPAGAQGLNTGVQDAYNLGWKLAQVLAGADERLLDTYESERLPIAAGVLGLSTKKYKAIAKLDPSAIRRGKDEQQLTLSYREGVLVSRGSVRTKSLQAGDRAPDALLRSLVGGAVRLYDLFKGGHFTAVAYGPQAIEHLRNIVWPSAGAELKRVMIGAHKGGAIGAVTDPDLSFYKQYGLSGDSIVVVRPDGYIAHIAHIATNALATSVSAAMSVMIPPADSSNTKDMHGHSAASQRERTA